MDERDRRILRRGREFYNIYQDGNEKCVKRQRVSSQEKVFLAVFKRGKTHSGVASVINSLSSPFLSSEERQKYFDVFELRNS